jgi:hypothetical protein
MNTDRQGLSLLAEHTFRGGYCSATVIPSDRKEHCDWRESRNLYTEATLAIAGRDSSTRYARSE